MAKISLNAFLLRDMPQRHHKEWVQEKTTDLLDEFRFNKMEMFKAIDGKDIIGYMCFVETDDKDCKEVCLTDLYTLPSDKRPGDALISFFLKNMIQKKIERIFLGTTDNAASFYKRYGFRETKADNETMALYLPNFQLD